MVEYFGHVAVPKISYSGASLGQIEGKKADKCSEFLVDFVYSDYKKIS